MRLFAALLSLVLLAVATAIPAGAQDTPPPVKGLFLLTDYPAVTVRPGTTTTINLRLRNYALPPERFALSVERRAAGWTVTLLGGGQPVARRDGGDQRQHHAATAARRAGERRDGDTQNLTVTAKGQSTEVTLPVAVTLAKDLPAKLTDQGAAAVAARHLEVELRVSSSRSRTTAAAISSSRSAAQAPQNFETSFTEQYGSQELSLDPDRGRPVQDRQAQGAAAEHDRRQPLSGLGEGIGRGRLGRHQRRARDHRSAAARRWPAATAC